MYQIHQKIIGFHCNSLGEIRWNNNSVFTFIGNK